MPSRRCSTLEAELAALDARLGHAGEAELERLITRQSEVHARLEILGAHEIERQSHQVLTGLGFAESEFDRPLAPSRAAGRCAPRSPGSCCSARRC